MRLINAEEVIMRLRVDPEEWGTPDESWLPEREYAMAIMTSPEIDPMKHGRWIYYEDETIEDGGRCSICQCDQPMFWEKKTLRYVETDYCPNCGARMDGDAE